MQLSFNLIATERKVDIVETILIIVVGIFALCFLSEKVSDLIKQLKSGSAKLSKGFEARISFVPLEDKKSEVSAANTNFTNDSLD